MLTHAIQKGFFQKRTAKQSSIRNAFPCDLRGLTWSVNGRPVEVLVERRARWAAWVEMVEQPPPEGVPWEAYLTQGALVGCA